MVMSKEEREHQTTEAFLAMAFLINITPKEAAEGLWNPKNIGAYNFECTSPGGKTMQTAVLGMYTHEQLQDYMIAERSVRKIQRSFRAKHP